MSAWDEISEWRKIVGLPTITLDLDLQAFAEEKAIFRAKNRLKDGHDGPACPPGCREGTGEALPLWGWLTCVMEEDAQFGGAGMCVGYDNDRYMVLVLRGGSGKALIPRHNIPIHNTSHLTPNPPSVHNVDDAYLCYACRENAVLGDNSTFLRNDRVLICSKCSKEQIIFGDNNIAKVRR